MSIAIVISTATYKASDGLIHATGTVNGGASLNVTLTPDDLTGLTATQIKQAIAAALIEANNTDLTFSVLTGSLTL